MPLGNETWHKVFVLNIFFFHSKLISPMTYSLRDFILLSLATEDEIISPL